jgi:Cu-processing system permease protein
VTYGFLTMVWLTLHEARRRRLVLAAFLCAVAFIAVVAVGQYFANTQTFESVTPLVQKIQLAMTTVVALYAARFFIVLIAVVLAIDTVSGEIQSGVMQTIASKPISRADILLGKWVAYFVLSAGFALLLVGGVLVSAYFIGGYRPPNFAAGMLLLLLEIGFMLAVAIAGGTVFGTVVNGIVAFSFFAIGFVGGWIEQIGTFAESEGARHTGVLLSLLSPGDAIWRLASFYLQPALVRYLPGTPFTSMELANGWMIGWTLAYSVVVFLFGLRIFSRRSI